ncbi:GyrI-like domain-containing protein [Staphylococcus kloosii]|nr:effector binding domain-containing protein [Staphylococcus kloosii]SUM48396.1 transcriptional activator [Staphylococcus kloosii]
MMNYRVEEKVSFIVSGYIREYASGQEAQENIYRFWLDFNEYNNGQYLMGLKNNQLDGLVGLCIPRQSGAMDYLIGVSVNKAINGCETIELPVTKYIVFDAVGKVPESIHRAMKEIHQQVLPKLDITLKNAPFFELYHSGDTGDDNYVTELWFPIE